MSDNNTILMAKFIHSHPELQMQPPRIWRTHYEDECKHENKIYSFSVLKQYSSLVRIQKLGRNSLYGSAKIPAKVLPSQPLAKTSAKKTISNQGQTSKATTTVTVTTDKSCQLELNYTAESALKEIQQIMSTASQKIQQIVRKTSSSRSEDKNKDQQANNK